MNGTGTRSSEIESLLHMKIDVKETVQKDLVDILQKHEGPKLAENICDRGLRRSVISILKHDYVRSQLLAILALPFQGIITANALNSFAKILKAGAQRYLSNAFRRILDFWKELPPSPSLVKWLEGKWGYEITEEDYKRWSEAASEFYPRELLHKIRNYSCRIITLRIVIAEAHAFHFFIKSFTPTATLEDFLGKVSEFTSNDPIAPKWTKHRQVSRPNHGIWSQKPHESIKDLYLTSTEPLIYRGRLSIKVLFQDFVMVFFGGSVYKDLGSQQNETTVQRCLSVVGHMENSISIQNTKQILTDHGMVPIDYSKEVNKTSEHPEGQFRLGYICRSPPMPTRVCHESQTASLLDTETFPPAEISACSPNIRKSNGTATVICVDKSTASTLEAGKNTHPGQDPTCLYTEKAEARDLEKVDVRASVADPERTIEDLVYDTNDVSERNIPKGDLDFLQAVSNPTASRIAECYRADLVSLAGEYWESDATTLNEPETPIPDEERLRDMYFIIVRLLGEEDPERLYLVPASVSEPSEIVQVIQERCHHFSAPTQRDNTIEDSRREAAIAMYGRRHNLTNNKKNTMSTLKRMVPYFPRSTKPKASTTIGPVRSILGRRWMVIS